MKVIVKTGLYGYHKNITISGLEHIISNKTAFNFVATILPVEVNGIKDATIVFRLKNHYAPVEEHLISQNHLTVPKPSISRYDIFNWKNIYFSVFYCFPMFCLGSCTFTKCLNWFNMYQI